MSDTPDMHPSAALPPSSAAKDKDSGRSRVYIACSLCRQRKIKCGGEQPVCRNCARSDLECKYDSEPKRRGPDKKPGTRVRTRKDSTGTVLPSKPRVSCIAHLAPASSDEPLLVPSQAGPTRNKKRPPRPSAGLASRGSRVGERVPDEGIERNVEPTRKISPPTLPYELGRVVPFNSNGRSPPRQPPAAGPAASPNQVSPIVRLPQLPALIVPSLPGALGPSVSEPGLNNERRGLVSCNGPRNLNSAYDYPGAVFLPEEQLYSASSTSDISASPNSIQDPHLPQIPSNSSSGTSSAYAGSTLNTDLNSPSVSIPLSSTHSASPVFTRLQYNNDPHFRPPADVLAGLAYPRARIAVPVLGRGSRPAGFGLRGRDILDDIDSPANNSNRLGIATGPLGLDGIHQATGLVSSDADRTTSEVPPYAIGAYDPVVPSQPDTFDHTASRNQQPEHQVPNDIAYNDYASGRYTAQSSRHYRSPSDSYSIQTDSTYIPPSESDYETSLDYSSQVDGYSTTHLPTEITIIPPPVGGLVGIWSGGVSSSANLYDESVGSGLYTSRTYGLSCDVNTKSSEYDETTLTESDAQSQVDEVTLVHQRCQDQFAQRVFYKTATSWVSEPSVDFARKTWWDNLLEMYAPTKSEAARQITFDLKYLFKSTNYWMSFFNINLFMTNYNHRERRENIQPSLILAALAYSTFTQSSEIERGQAGRSRAMELRNLAQSALEASLNSQRLDSTLAQAAWLLAIFEVSAHPEHSTARSRSALMFLDNIIRLLGLTVLDAMDPQAPVFSPGQVPRIALSPNREDSHSSVQYPLTAQRKPAVPATCACHALSIACTTTHAQLTPFWVSSPGWDPTWTEAEIRREEGRRLVWSSLTLTAGFTAHDAAFAKDPADLHLVHASNYALCFPGEVMMRGVPNSVHSPQENVWALYARAMLLWNSCLVLRKAAPHMTEAQCAEFAVNVWLETNSIEEALNRHTCEFERNSLFQGREYLFNTRMFISWEFRRYIPSPDTEVHQQFHRRKAEEWLRHQAQVAKRLMQGLHTVTGLSSNVLGKRPYFVWWFMSQVSRCLSLWQCDQSLFVALEVARAFLPPIDYLTCLWPCPAQRSRYHDIRQRLHNECVKYGLEPPPPPQLVIPTAIF